MASRSALRSLMTGAAIASLSTAALADGWNGLIIFGGRDYDSGQYVSTEAVFPDGEELGDGRLRGTNLVEEGGYGRIISQRVADALGFGEVTPSQPQTYGSVTTPPDGYNYAAAFYSSANIRDSIIGSVSTSTINYLSSDDIATSVEGRSRLGLLNDPDRRADAWGALVLVGSSQRDLRFTANIDRGLDSEVDLDDSGIVLDPTLRDLIAVNAASNIATGVNALAEANAGLVVVANAYDAGSTPEANGDVGLLGDADTLLLERVAEAEQAAASAQAAANSLANLDTIVTTNQSILSDMNSQYNALLEQAATESEEESDTEAAEAAAAARQAAIDSLLQQIATAEANLETAEANRNEQAFLTDEANAEAAELAITQAEADLRIQIDAALADPSLIADTRTAATDLYNTSLTERLRSIDGNIVQIDQRALFDAVIADPARFGLSTNYNQGKECLDSNALYACNEVNAAVDELLFATGISLTETGHQLAADQITAMVTAPATISGLPAIGISAARGITDASRDQVSREQSWKAGVAPFVSGVASRVKLNKSTGFPEQNGGFYSGVAGLKYVIAPGIAVGLAGGYQKVTTPGNDQTLKYDGSAIFGTAFAGINSGPVFGNITATYGVVDYGDVTRISTIGAAEINNTGDTEGTVAGVTAEAGLRLVEYDILRAGPIANFSHWRSDADGYAENGWEATAVSTGDLSTTSTRAGIGIFMEAGQIADGHGSVFRAKALYGHEFGDDTKTASVTPLGNNSLGSFSTQVRGVDDAPLEFGAEVVLGYRGVLTTFGYDGILGDVSDHRFRIGASMPL